MKVIISHDVDHLYPSDHITRDLIFPKLWLRSTLELLKKQINLLTWYYRLISIFDKRLNRIPEIIEYDIRHKVKSTFFFGVDNILGMSYKKDDVKPWIIYVINKGMDVGVHGVNYCDIESMQKEFALFKQYSGKNAFGMRFHYVRYNQDTFQKLSDIGYLFDSTEFCKSGIIFKDPYLIGNLWEFPLHIMDSYIMKGDLEYAKKITINVIKEAINFDLSYFTFLFHDYMFNSNTYPNDKKYYEWFIEYCNYENIEFISYIDAISELTENRI